MCNAVTVARFQLGEHHQDLPVEKITAFISMNLLEQIQVEKFKSHVYVYCTTLTWNHTKFLDLINLKTLTLLCYEVLKCYKIHIGNFIFRTVVVTIGNLASEQSELGHNSTHRQNARTRQRGMVSSNFKWTGLIGTCYPRMQQSP
jgi:hypothetical protein